LWRELRVTDDHLARELPLAIEFLGFAKTIAAAG
jgi:hypothetical protein